MGDSRPVDDRKPSGVPVGAGYPKARPTDVHFEANRPPDGRTTDSPSTRGMGADPRPTVKLTQTRQAQTSEASFERADRAYCEKAPARQVLVSEDEVWIQYGTADAPDWPSKCAECREGVSLWKSPITSCVNCWKVEVWGSSEALPRPMDWYDLGDAAEAVVLRTCSVIKVSKEPIPVVRSGIPEEGYPAADFDYLLMGYAETISQRDALREALCSALGLGPRQANLIPVRRGCWFYDELLGPWTEWYLIDQDMRKVT